VVESWKGQIDKKSNLNVVMLADRVSNLNAVTLAGIAEKELSKNITKYGEFLQLPKGQSDIILTYMDKYFTHKLYDNDLTDLIPLVLCNALRLKINIIEERNFGNVIQTTIDPYRDATHAAKHTIFIHLKNQHYSALVPRDCPPRLHRTIGRPNHSNLCTNQFTALSDAPDTCIYTEEVSDSSLGSQNITPSCTMPAKKSYIKRNASRENGNKQM
jgi:hypothetical protein